MSRIFMSLVFAFFGVLFIGTACLDFYKSGEIGPLMFAGFISLIYSYIRYRFLT